MKQFLITLLILSSLIFTACPKRSDIDRAFDVSANLAKTTEITAKSVLVLYEQNIISLELKDRIAAKLRVVVTNGKKFHNALSDTAKIFGSIEKIPVEERRAIDLLFKNEILIPIAELVAELANLSPSTKEKIFAAIAALQIAVSTIVTIFGSSTASYEFYKENNVAYAEI